MKQGNYVSAYKAIQNIQTLRMPVDLALAFFRVKKNLQDQWDFQLQEEQKIFSKYHVTQGQNGLQLEDPKKQEAFMKELRKLSELEIDGNVEKVSVKIDGRIEMSVEDIEALSEFMNIKP